MSVVSENMAGQSVEESGRRGREKFFTEVFINFLENSSFNDEFLELFHQRWDDRIALTTEAHLLRSK